MSFSMSTPVTIEQVAHQLQIWRQNKTSKFDRIPTHLKELIFQLLPHYRKQTIMRQLYISSTTFSSIKKSHHLNPKNSHTKLHNLGETNSRNTSTNSNSEPNPNPNPKTPSESKMSFIPFQLSTHTPTPSCSYDPVDSPTFEASSSKTSNCATSHITKANGSSLIIKTSSDLQIKSVIQAFLCFN